MSRNLSVYEFALGARVDARYCFQPLEGLTHCNDYAAVVCAAMGCPLPTGKANDQLADLAAGRVPGYLACTRAEALQRANSQQVVVMGITEQPHGHIVVLTESPTEDPSNLYCTAAGVTNFVRARVEASFGKDKAARAVYFWHA